MSKCNSFQKRGVAQNTTVHPRDAAHCRVTENGPSDRHRERGTNPSPVHDGDPETAQGAPSARTGRRCRARGLHCPQWGPSAPPQTRTKTRTSALAIGIQRPTGVPAGLSGKDRTGKGGGGGTRSLFARGGTSQGEQPKTVCARSRTQVHTHAELGNQSAAAEYKTQKPAVFLHVSNERSQNEAQETIPFTIASEKANT